MSSKSFYVLLLNGVYTAAYFAGGYLGVLLAVPPSNASPVWPGAGIALAGLLLHGNKILPGIFLGAAGLQTVSFLIAAEAVPVVHSLILGLGASAGSCMQAWVGSFLIKRFIGRHDPLIEDQKVLQFFLLGGPVSCLISASAGVLMLVILNVLSVGNIWLAWVTWWVGDTIGVVIFAPLVLLLSVRPESFWKPRRQLVVYPLILLFIAVVGVFKYSQQLGQNQVEANFLRQVQRYHTAIENEIRIHLKINHTLKAFFESHDHTTLISFHDFIRPVFSEHNSIQALEWIPRIRAEEREAFERKTGFKVREKNLTGNMVDASFRDVYYPIMFAEPHVGNEKAFGFDINSNSVVNKILDGIIDSGQTGITGRIQLVQDSIARAGMVMYSPVYVRHAEIDNVKLRREHFLGFVASVFRVEDVVAEVTEFLQDSDLELSIFDGEELLYDSKALPGREQTSGFSNLQIQGQIDISGRTWVIKYRPSQHFYARQQSWSSWWVLIGGLLLTSLTGIGLLLLTGRAARVEELVNVRTRELELANKHLSLEISRRKQLQLEQSSRNDVLELLAKPVSLNQVLEKIALHVERQRLGVLCSILLFDHDKNCLICAAAPSLPDFYLKAIDGVVIGDNVGSCGTAAYRKQTVIVDDIDSHPAWRNYKEPAQKAGFRACWSEPILSAGKDLLGTFAIYSRKVESPGQEDLKYIQRMVRLSALAIQKKNHESELRIAAITFQSHDAIAVTRLDGTILRVNQAFTSITGYSEQEALGKTPRLLSSGVHDGSFYREMFRQLKKAGRWQGEIWNKRKNGEVYPEWLTVTAVTDEHHVATHYVAIFSDITEKKAAEKEIHDLAFYDPLTGLPNRRLLMDRLSHEINVAVRHQRHGALLFLDLDHFKRLNDSLGHQVGDELLNEVASRIAKLLREEDTACRMGGDEFVIMTASEEGSLQKATERAASLAERINAAINRPFELQDSRHHFSTSIGISIFPDDSVQPEQVIQQADTAMYRAKENGRNEICFFETAMQEAAGQRLILEKEMRTSLQNTHFVLYYQPQVDQQGRLISVEALIRWLHPEKGMISPSLFIPLAEETRLIIPLGQWVLEEACRQIKIWQQRGLNIGHVAVNVSSRQFRQGDFVAQVKKAIQQYQVDPQCLMIELTEGSVIDNIDDTIAKMKQLKSMGVEVSIDDFGTGYSSLSYLKQLPLSQLKIDQSFVRDIASDVNDAVIVETIINMAKNLGLNVIAEGVETREQTDFLLQHGCQSFQGYFFARPQTAEDILKFAGITN